MSACTTAEAQGMRVAPLPYVGAKAREPSP